MPVVALISYFTHIDSYGRWWFTVPRTVEIQRGTSYKLAVLERQFRGCSPVRGHSYWCYPKKNNQWSPEAIESMKGSMVKAIVEFKRYWGAPMPNPMGWNLTIVTIELLGGDLTLS